MGGRGRPDVGVVRDATPADARDLGPRLRPEDADEVTVGTGMPGPVGGLLRSIDMSEWTKAWVRDGRVVAMGGVVPIEGTDRGGNAWFLAAPEALRPPHLFHRLALEALTAVVDHYDPLMAASRSDLSVHHRWLRRLGFVPVSESPPFIFFAWRP